MLPDTVSDYFFCDREDKHISFSKLSVQWNETESSSGDAGPIFLCGSADNGRQKLYKQVKAWKYNFSNANPEISVLCEDKNWIKLQKPRESFENEIRTILITVHCLHFFKSEPEASGKALWDHLSKVFSLYNVRPSENDLKDCMNFIREAVKRDETLAKSKFLAAFLEKNPIKKITSDKDAKTVIKLIFIVDGMNDEPQDAAIITIEVGGSNSNDEFDSLCAICDDGGELICCEGKCLRSFHANRDSKGAKESSCKSLGLSAEVVKGTQPFICPNCQVNRHQCFVCGELGSSDRSSAAKVFRCSSATCGHFYHPQCAAELLQRQGDSKLHGIQEKLAAGEPFTCPAHRCVVCRLAENEKVKDLQFAICRRCPTSYHRKCLPRGIMFDREVCDDGMTRAWDNVLPKSRASIYCFEHEIDERLGTPARNLIFQHIRHSKKKQSSEVLSNKKKVAVKEKGSSEKRNSTGRESSKNKGVADTSKNPLKRTLSTEVRRPSSDDSQPFLETRLLEYLTNGIKSINLEKDDTSADNGKQTMIEEEGSPIDSAAMQRMLGFMKDDSSSIKLDENDAPHLYLWSHPDWTPKHTAIPLQHGHIEEKSGPNLKGDLRMPSNNVNKISKRTTGKAKTKEGSDRKGAKEKSNRNLKNEPHVGKPSLDQDIHQLYIYAYMYTYMYIYLHAYMFYNGSA